MAPSITTFFFFLSIFLTFLRPHSAAGPKSACVPMPPPYPPIPVHPTDVDMLQFAINIEHLEADFFLFGALGYGLDVVAPVLVMGGPRPIGAVKANLDQLTQNIITEFAYQEVGHLRALKSTVGGFPRPLLDLSSRNFAKIFDDAFGFQLDPPFDPYRNSVSYMLGSYVIPYMGLLGYVGANQYLIGYISRRLQAGLLGVEAGQDAIIRMYLYERVNELVPPYNITVEEFTNRISKLRDRLASCGFKDEGLIVPPVVGAEGRISKNVLSADVNSISYDRTPAEILRVVYGSGDEQVPGGFFPSGGNGKVAKYYLQQ